MKSIRAGIKSQELIFKPWSFQSIDRKEDVKFSLYVVCLCIRVCQDLFLLRLNPAIMMIEINNISLWVIQKNIYILMTWFTVMKLKTSEVLLSIMLGKAATLKLRYFFFPWPDTVLMHRFCSLELGLELKVLDTCDNEFNIYNEKWETAWKIEWEEKWRKNKVIGWCEVKCDVNLLSLEELKLQVNTGNTDSAGVGIV